MLVRKYNLIPKASNKKIIPILRSLCAMKNSMDCGYSTQSGKDKPTNQGEEILGNSKPPISPRRILDMDQVWFHCLQESDKSKCAIQSPRI